MALVLTFRPVSAHAALLGAFLMPIMMLPAALAAQAEGQALYEARCVRCHDAGPAGFRTAPERVEALLRAGSVRQHRFALSEAQLNVLTEYLRAGARR